jgi:hypothetical protein
MSKRTDDRRATPATAKAQHVPLRAPLIASSPTPHALATAPTNPPKEAPPSAVLPCLPAPANALDCERQLTDPQPCSIGSLAIRPSPSASAPHRPTNAPNFRTARFSARRAPLKTSLMREHGGCHASLRALPAKTEHARISRLLVCAAQGDDW